jgi:hypothetical protein
MTAIDTKNSRETLRAHYGPKWADHVPQIAGYLDEIDRLDGVVAAQKGQIDEARIARDHLRDAVAPAAAARADAAEAALAEAHRALDAVAAVIVALMDGSSTDGLVAALPERFRGLGALVDAYDEAHSLRVSEGALQEQVADLEREVTNRIDEGQSWAEKCREAHRALAEATEVAQQRGRRISDLKLALGDDAGWFDRFHDERAKREKAEEVAQQRGAMIAALREAALLPTRGTATFVRGTVTGDYTQMHCTIHGIVYDSCASCAFAMEKSQNDADRQARQARDAALALALALANTAEVATRFVDVDGCLFDAEVRDLIHEIREDFDARTSEIDLDGTITTAIADLKARRGAR